MIGPLSLPALALTIVVFLAFIWNRWLKNPADRSLRIGEDDEDGR